MVAVSRCASQLAQSLGDADGSVVQVGHLESSPNMDAQQFWSPEQQPEPQRQQQQQSRSLFAQEMQ
jgi:hypothetical protein